MRKLLTVLLCLFSTAAHAAYLGSWKIDDLLTFAANTHRFDTGQATDADSVPSYRVYEDETGTAILTGSMALLDDANTAGFYSEQLTLSAANGFEKGKSYTVYVSAAVNSVTGTTSHTFQLEAEVDANVVSDKTGYDVATIETVDATDYIEGRTLAAASYFDPTADTVATVTTLTGHTPQTGDSFARIGAAGAGLTEAGGTGDHLTAIDLPNQTMDITGNLSGSVGSVLGKIGGLTALALADLFDTDSGTVYGAAVAGSVVKEIVDNAGGSSLTVADIVDGVWDEDIVAAHGTADTAGLVLSGLTHRSVTLSTGVALGSVFGQLFDDGTAWSFARTDDSLEALRARGDAAWITATGFSTHTAADVWAVGTRELTGAANITSTGGTTVPQTGDSFARLAAYRLGELLSASLSAPAAGSLYAELTEDDGGTQRFTANALEEAPSGAGATDWTSGEKEEIRFRLSMSGTQTDPVTTTGGVEIATTGIEVGDFTAGAIDNAAVADNFITNQKIAASAIGVSEAPPFTTILADTAALIAAVAVVDDFVDDLESRLGTPAVTVSDDIAAVPTATENADELLKRDWTSVSGESARSVLNALRFLRNRWHISGTTLTVEKEDDTTDAWTATITATPGVDPVTAVDP